MHSLELQNKFAIQVSKLIAHPSDELHVHYENDAVDGVPREVFSAKLVNGGKNESVDIPLEAIDILVEIQREPLVGQAEKWRWMTFSMRGDGSYRFHFEYTEPPLIKEQIKYSK